MPFPVKNWVDGQTLDAVGLEDLESRLSVYASVESVNTVVGAGTNETIPDPTTQSINVITLNAGAPGCTFVFPSAVAGTSFTLVLKQDATGNRLAVWPLSVRWASAVAPTLTTTANAIDVFSFVCVDGATWYGFTAGKAMG